MTDYILAACPSTGCTVIPDPWNVPITILCGFIIVGIIIGAVVRIALDLRRQR